MDGYRVFTCDAERFPDPPAFIAELGERRLQDRHDHRPGREGRRGLRRLHRGPRARPLLQDARRTTSTATSSGPACARSRTSRTRARATWWGEQHARAARRGRRRRLVRHERAGAVRPGAVDDARGRRAPGRRRAAAARAGPQPLRLADGAGHARGAARGCGPSGARSSSPAPASPACSATRCTGRATTRPGGSTCG